MDLHVLSAGAAQGVVEALAVRLREERGAGVHGTFGAVGAMRAKLDSGAPCDLVILTAAQIAELEGLGRIACGEHAPLGRVRTGVAVRDGEAVPDVATPQALRAALVAARDLYIPDPRLATAGVHIAGVLERLGIAEALAPRLRAYPNGSTAMRELARSTGGGQLGCTQVTEIRYTRGVTLAGVLPPPYELATVYTAAVCAAAREPALARDFLSLLAAPESQALRAARGFE